MSPPHEPNSRVLIRVSASEWARYRDEVVGLGAIHCGSDDALIAHLASGGAAGVVWEVSGAGELSQGTIREVLLQRARDIPLVIRVPLTPPGCAAVLRVADRRSQWSASIIGIDDLARDVARLAPQWELTADSVVLDAFRQVVPASGLSLLVAAALVGRSRSCVSTLARACGCGARCN